jgi:hypothetical protein
VPAAGRERCGKTGYQSSIPVLVLVWLACWSGSLDSQLQGVIKLGAQNGQGTRIAIRFPLYAVSARSSIAEAGCAPYAAATVGSQAFDQPSIRSMMMAGAMPPAAHMVTRP